MGLVGFPVMPFEKAHPSEGGESWTVLRVPQNSHAKALTPGNSIQNM